MIAVTSFICVPRLGWPWASELVEALDGVREQALAEARAVRVDGLVRLVLAQLAAKLEGVARQIGQRQRDFAMLGARNGYAVGRGGGDRARETEPVLVVQRLEAQR